MEELKITFNKATSYDESDYFVITCGARVAIGETLIQALSEFDKIIITEASKEG